MKLGMDMKTFHAPVADAYDEYPEAFCCIYGGKVTTDASFSGSDTGEGQYTEFSNDISGGAYRVIFWNSSAAKANDKLCRPLFHDVDGKTTGVFTLDVEHPEAIQIINSELGYEEKILHLMRRDLARRFQ